MARLIRSLKIALFLFIIIMPSFAKAEYTWWSLGDKKFISFPEFEQAWNKQVKDYITKPYQLFLLREPDQQDIDKWLAVYKQNSSLTNKKDLKDAWNEIQNGQEAKDLNLWKQTARGSLLRTNCAMPNDQQITALAKDGKWKTDNSADKLGTAQKDCHYKNSSNNSSDIILSIITLIALLAIPIFTLVFRRKNWKIIHFLKDSLLGVYSAGLLLYVPLSYLTKGASYLSVIFIGFIGLFCLYHFVKVITKKRKSLLRKIGRILLSILWLVPIAIILFFSSSVAYQNAQNIFPKPFIVDGASMEPTLKNNQFVTADKNIYKKEQLQRDDIIVLHRPVLEDKDNFKYIYIKRIVGLPNEVIEIKEGYLWVNGVKQTESFLPEQGKTYTDFSIKLQNNEYFVLGDNRLHSADSREFGPITKEDIIGKVQGDSTKNKSNNNLKYLPPIIGLLVIGGAYYLLINRKKDK
jgi:signal peptidase I